MQIRLSDCRTPRSPPDPAQPIEYLVYMVLANPVIAEGLFPFLSQLVAVNPCHVTAKEHINMGLVGSLILHQMERE